MINKYYKNTAYFIADVDFQSRYRFMYKWYINNKLISQDYSFNYKFEKPGKYFVKSEITDKETNLVTVNENTVNIIVHRQDYLYKELPLTTEFYFPYADLGSPYLYLATNGTKIVSLGYYKEEEIGGGGGGGGLE